MIDHDGWPGSPPREPDYNDAMTSTPEEMCKPATCEPTSEDVASARRIREMRENMGRLLAEQTRQRFVLVGKLRLQLGLSHPRRRHVQGSELKPGWIFFEFYRGNCGEFTHTMAFVVVEITDQGWVHYLGLDPSDGRNVYCSSRGDEGKFWVDDMSIPEEPGLWGRST